jgi:predicted PurR-regulated permease PerM
MLGFDLRTAKITWTVFLVGLLLFTLYSIRPILFVIVAAIFFAYLLYPLVRLVERYGPRRIPRTAAIAIVFIIALTIVAFLVVLFGGRIVDQAGRLWQELPRQLNTANISQHIPLPGFLEPQRARLHDFIREQLQIGTGEMLPFVQKLAVGTVRAVTNSIYLVLVPILSFLFLKDGRRLTGEILSWVGGANGSMLAGIAEDVHILLATYVRAILLLSIATFIIYGTVFSVLGVPYALLLSGLAGVLEAIPVFGPLTAAAATLGVSAISGYGHLWWLIAFFIVYRIFQDYMLGPYVMSEGVDLSPLLVIIGLLVGEQLGGVAGIFLAVPVLAALKIILIKVRGARAKTAAPEMKK